MNRIKIVISILLSAAVLSACNNPITGKTKNQNDAGSTPSVSDSQNTSTSTSGETKKTNGGSTNTNNGGSGSATTSGSTNQSSDANKVSFTLLKDADIPDSIASDIKTLTNKRGYYYRKSNDSYYIGVFSGKEPTGGYKVEISSLVDKDGKTSILVKETKPSKSDSVTQSVTYPYVIIKTPQITDNFEVKTTDGEILDQLHVLR